VSTFGRFGAGTIAFAATLPDSLRGRILDAARAERPNNLRFLESYRPRDRIVLRVAAADAACTVAGLTLWNVALHDELGRDHQALSGSPLTGASGARTIVVRLTRAVPAGSVVAVTLERAGCVSQPTETPLITSAPI
jgi:hypothetical protein